MVNYVVEVATAMQVLCLGTLYGLFDEESARSHVLPPLRSRQRFLEKAVKHSLGGSRRQSRRYHPYRANA